MRILVTGDKGYFGTVLVPMLIADGHDVVGLDSDLYQRCTFGDELPETQSIQKDLRDDEFEGPKYKRIDHIRQLLSNGLLDNTLRWVKVTV